MTAPSAPLSPGASPADPAWSPAAGREPSVPPPGVPTPAVRAARPGMPPAHRGRPLPPTQGRPAAAAPSATPTRRSDRTGPADSRHVAAVAVAALLAALGGSAFAPLAETRALTVVPFAAAIPAVLAIALRRGALPVAIPVWVLAGVSLARGFATTTASLPDTVRGGLVDGFRTALTSALPLPASPAVLFWIFTLVFWAAYWAARAARAAAAAGLVLLPPALVLLTGTAFGIAAPGRVPPAAAPFAGAAVVLLAVRGGVSVRRLAAALLGCAIIVCGAVAAAGRLPYAGRRPAFDPRSLVRQPVRTERQISPLALATLWAAQPPRPLFRLDTSTPVNQRLAVFDDYDGREWSSSAAYVRAGTLLPAGDGRPGRSVRETVTVGDLAVAWLPAPDRPVRVTGTPVGVDRRTGVLTTADGRPAAGLRYTVTSRTPALTAAQAAAATPAYGPGVAADLRVPPDVPLSITRDADRLSPPDAPPYQRLLAIQDHLRRHYRYDVRAAPGRTVGHLHFFYDKSHRGTADQFATVFALMARHLGIPARVAVGFTPGHAGGPGRYEVTTADVVVWAEVELRGLGWVPFYPVPRAGNGPATVGRSAGETPERAALDRAVAAAPVRHPSAGPARPAPRSVPPDGGAASRALAYGAAGGGLLVLLLAGYLLTGPLMRAAARRRRRSGGPYERVVGAWQEAVEQLARLPGVSGLSALTAEEVAERARGRLGAEAGIAVAGLAGRLSTAVYSPRPPDAAGAAAAWDEAARLRAMVTARLGRGRRLRELVRPPWRAGRSVRRSAGTASARFPVTEEA